MKVRDDWGRFEDWAKEAGIEWAKNSLAEFKGGLRGVKATRAIAEGDILMSTPDSAVLKTIEPNPKLPNKLQGYVSEQVWKEGEWWLRLALLLCYEQGVGRTGGDVSEKKAWLDVLPDEMDTPLHWTDEEIDALEYAPLVQKVKDQRGRWNTVHASVASANPAIGKKELFLACEMARSRAFSGPFVNKLPKDLFFLTGLMVAVSTQLNILDGKSAAVATFVVAASLLAQAFVLPSVLGLQHYVLAPRIDMINHRGGSKSQVTYQALQASFEVVAAAPVAEGEEVFISYGTRSNDQLLQYYGFVENNNPDDVYEIPSFASRVQQVSGASIASVMEAKAGLEAGDTALVSQTGVSDAALALAESICGSAEAGRSAIAKVLQEEQGKFAKSLAEEETALKISRSSGKPAVGSPAGLAMALRVAKLSLLRDALLKLS